MLDAIERNKRRAVVLMGLFVALSLAVFTLVFRRMGLGGAAPVLALLSAAAVGVISYWTADRLTLWLCGARPASAETYAQPHNLLEGLALAAGMPKPDLYVVEDDAANAFATGRDARHGAVVVTTGLLALLNRAELESVLAHELNHIRHRDVLVATVAVTTVGLIGLVTDLSLRFGGRRESRDGVLSSILGFLVLLVAPVAARLLRFAVSRDRETLADIAGAELTRHPGAMISALEKLRDSPTVVRRTSRATAHLWICSPLPDADESDGGGRFRRLHRLFDTHPPLDERITRLRTL